MANKPGLSGERDETSPDSPGSSGSRGTILLVEDEKNVRALLSRILERQGYLVIDASNGAEALQRAREYLLPIHLLITDVTMPLVNGLELVRQLLPLRPDMKVIIMTGQDKQGIPQGPSITFFEKPFTMTGLLARVEQVLK